MKKIQAVLLLFFIFFSFASFGQGNVKVTGKVVDQDTKQPLEFATVTIQAGDKTVNGAMTDAKGEYSISVAPGTYNIKIDFISFKQELIADKAIIEDTNLGVTVMSADATLLQEVEIRAERSTVDFKLDKKVYNVGQDMIVKGGSVSDVLDNVPSVSVDVEGNVSLRGNESVTILIDGRPSNLAGGNIADVLKLLPADSVDKVEIITNPSARYDAEGGGGIINIVLRKGKAGGFNGSVIASTGTPANHGIMANLNYRSENYNLFSNLGYNYRNSPGNSFTNSQYFNEDGSTREYINEKRDNESLRKGINATFGAEWFIDESLTWTNSVSLRKNNGENPTNTYFDNYFADGSYNNTRYRYNFEDNDEDNVQFSTNLLKKFDKEGHELKIDASISKSNENEDATITDTTFGNPDVTSQTTYNYEDEQRSLLQADYVLPLGKDSRFEAGYRGSFNKIKINSGAEELEDEGWVPLDQYTSVLQYNEYVNALYSQFGSKIGKFSYLLGLRWEDSNIDVNVVNQNNFNNKRYNNFFPSAFLSYEFGEGSSASLSYSRRINRPRGRFINPFSGLQSNINIFVGNPDLNPSMTNAFELGYLKKWGKVTLNSSVYFNATDDSFQFVKTLVNVPGQETPVTYTTPINLANEYRFGFELNANYTAAKWWRLNGNFNLFNNETKGDYTFTYTDPVTGETTDNYQNFNNSAFGWMAKFNSKMNLPLGIDWQLNGTYNAPQNNAQGRSVGIFSANTALSKDLFKDQATLTLNVSDIFNSRKRKAYTDIPNEIYSYSEMQWRQRQVTLSFTWRFNMSKQDKQKQERQQRQDGGGDDEYMGG